jgi:hypothetical protein
MFELYHRYEVKNFVASVFATLVIFLLVDILFGVVVNKAIEVGERKYDKGYLKISRAMKGQFNYLMIGDSRSYYNIDPQILDNVGESFNGAIEGSSINFWIKFLEIKKSYNFHKTKKYVIEIPPTIFLNSNLDKKITTKYLLSLDKKGLFRKDLNWLENIFVRLNTFKYRDLLMSVINGAVQKNISVTGFHPLLQDEICKRGPKCKDFSGVDATLNVNRVVSKSIIDDLERLFEKNKSQVIFVSSPFYNDLNPAIKIDIDVLGYAIEELSSRGFKVLDYRLDDRFLNKDQLFKDAIHLNKMGATLFSKILANEI